MNVSIFSYAVALRYDGAEAEKSFKHGAWERAISLYRTQYSYFAVAYKDKANIIYFAPGR